MIYLTQNNREYDYDVRAIALAFFEREKIKEVTGEEAEIAWREAKRKLQTGEEESGGADGQPETGAVGKIKKKDNDGGKSAARLLFLQLDFTKDRILGRLEDICGKSAEEEVVCDYADHGNCRNEVCRFLYRLFEKFTGRSLPWGMLTGIRPTKIIMKWMEEEQDPEMLARRFAKTYLTEEGKARLCVKVAKKEREILSSRDFSKEYSLYIGIPFCPTTCLYCSFTSFPVSRFGDKMPEYLKALHKELSFVSKVCKGKKLTSIYIGGGTPTALDEVLLARLMEMIHALFPVEQAEEFTVEAGRPDSVTKEKFRILREAGVGRISINPQTMHQETLDLIGRLHTVEQTKEAFYLARESGFDNINMDMITGLPGENLSHVKGTLAEISRLAPESLTVHSLAIKRAAHLNLEMEKYQALVGGSTNEMLCLAGEYAADMGMEPYYMYRQKNIPGNMENTGYCIPGKECLYNILIMEETQDIIACGAGASAKYVFKEENRIERTENVKNLDHYIRRIDEMIDRKRKYLERGYYDK